MKQFITTTGRVELSHQEITQAILEFLSTHYNYKGTSVVYLPSSEKFSGAVVEVKQELREQVERFKKPEKQERNGTSGWIIQNKGLYDTLRELMNEAFDKKPLGQLRAEIKFPELVKTIIDLFPAMDAKKLNVYLYDKRMFTNMDYYATTGQIIIKGKVSRQVINK